MKKIIKFCFMIALSSIMLIGCAQSKDSNNTNEREKISKYTMPDEKSEHEVHGYNGRMNSHMVKSIKKR